jgi:hypothetical protein
MNKIERLRKAARNGWHVVDTKPTMGEWLLLLKWCDKNTNGYYTYSYTLGKIAFEQQKDASWFALKWL